MNGTAYEVPYPAGYEMVQAPDSSRDCPASLLPPGVSPTSNKACGCTLFLGQGSSPGGLGLSSRSKVNSADTFPGCQLRDSRGPMRLVSESSSCPHSPVAGVVSVVEMSSCKAHAVVETAIGGGTDFLEIWHRESS